jgi:hypothetical protein
VVETGNARPDGIIRNLIRSHARRGKTKQSRVVAPDPVFLNKDKENEVTDQNTRRRNPRMSIQCKQKVKNAQVNRGPGNNASDPFGILPVSEHGHTLALINHCALPLLYSLPWVLHSAQTPSGIVCEITPK